MCTENSSTSRKHLSRRFSFFFFPPPQRKKKIATSEQEASALSGHKPYRKGSRQGSVLKASLPSLLQHPQAPCTPAQVPCIPSLPAGLGKFSLFRAGPRLLPRCCCLPSPHPAPLGCGVGAGAGLWVPSSPTPRVSQPEQPPGGRGGSPPKPLGGVCTRWGGPRARQWRPPPAAPSPRKPPGLPPPRGRGEKKGRRGGEMGRGNRARCPPPLAPSPGCGCAARRESPPFFVRRRLRQAGGPGWVWELPPPPAPHSPTRSGQTRQDAA